MPRPINCAQITLPHNTRILSSLEYDLNREKRKLNAKQKDIFHYDLQKIIDAYIDLQPYVSMEDQEAFADRQPSYLNEVLDFIVEKYPDMPEFYDEIPIVESIRNKLNAATDRLSYQIVDNYRVLDVNALISDHFSSLCYQLFFVRFKITTLNNENDTIAVCQLIYDYIYFWYIRAINNQRKKNQASSSTHQELTADIARITKQIALTKHSLEKEETLLATQQPVIFNKAQIKEMCASLAQIDGSKVRLLEDSHGSQYLEFATQNVMATVNSGATRADSDFYPMCLQQHVRIPNMVWRVNLTESIVKARKLRSNHQHKSVITPQQPFYQQPWEMPPAFKGYARNPIPAPHFTTANKPCLGDFGNVIDDAIAKRDLHGIMSGIISFLSSIDPDDAAGAYWYKLVDHYTHLNNHKMLTAFQMPFFMSHLKRASDKENRSINNLYLPEDQSFNMQAINDWWDNEILQPLTPHQEPYELNPPSGYIDVIHPIYQFRADGSYRVLLVYLSQSDLYKDRSEDTYSLSDLLKTYHHHFDNDQLWRHKNYHQILLGHGNLGHLV